MSDPLGGHHGGDFFYVAMLAIPLAGLFLLAPALAAVALPQLAATLLAGFPATTDPRAHYIAGIVPFLVAATVLGLGRLSPAGRRRGVVLVLTLCVAFAVVLGPWPGTPGRSITSYWADVPEARVNALRRAVALVPRARRPPRRTDSARTSRSGGTSTACPSWAGLSGSWSNGRRVDPPAVRGGARSRPWIAFVARIRQSAAWVNVFNEDGVLVFRRAGA